MPTSDLTQRTMARRLPLTVAGAMGLTTGEVQWMDQQDVLFRCGEDLSSYTSVDARVDLGTLGQQVDLQIDRLRRVAEPGRGRGSYLHIARYQIRDEQDRQRLMKRLRRINPDLIAPDGGWSSDPTTVTKRSRSVSSRSRSVPSRSISDRSHTRTKATPSRPARSQGSRKIDTVDSANGRPSRTREADQASYRRAQRRASTPTPPKVGLPAILSSGTPPAVLAVIADHPTLQRLLKLDGTRLRLQVDPLDLRAGTELMLAIQLPDSTFVQITARVMANRPGSTLLGTDALMPSQLSAIKLHLRQ